MTMPASNNLPPGASSALPLWPWAGVMPLPLPLGSAPAAAPLAPAASPPGRQVAGQAKHLIDWGRDHAKADRNQDGLLTRKEAKKSGLSLAKQDFKKFDVDKDGKLSSSEHRAYHVEKNAFATLDADRNGALSLEEMAKLERHDDRAFDQDGNGLVSKSEFLVARRSELHANRSAKLAEDFKKLGDKEIAAWTKKADQNGDGKLTEAEYLTGRRGQREAKLIQDLMGSVTEKGKPFSVTEGPGAVYKGYDQNADGQVDKAEFGAGLRLDRAAAALQRLESGKVTDKGLVARLQLNRLDQEAPTAAQGDHHNHRKDWFISQFAGAYNTQEDVVGNGNCGPTSLTMVATAFGIIDPSPGQADAAIEKSRKMMGDGLNEISGTSAEGIVRGAKAYGLDAHIVNNIDLKDIQKVLAQGRLPIINGNYIRSDGSMGGGHFYVVTKIENGMAYLNDPAMSSGPRVVSTQQLMKSVNSHWGHRLISVGSGN